MSIAPQITGLAFANYVLSTTTLFALRMKGVLSIDEANEIVEQSLLNLETNHMIAGQSQQPSVEFARELFEQLRQALDESRPQQTE